MSQLFRIVELPAFGTNVFHIASSIIGETKTLGDRLDKYITSINIYEVERQLLDHYKEICAQNNTPATVQNYTLNNNANVIILSSATTSSLLYGAPSAIYEYLVNGADNNYDVYMYDIVMGTFQEPYIVCIVGAIKIYHGDKYTIKPIGVDDIMTASFYIRESKLL